MARSSPRWPPLRPLLIAGRQPSAWPSCAERVYAITVTASAGGWLAAATAAGPAHGPLPQFLLIACRSSRCPGGRTGDAAPRSVSNACLPPGPRSPKQSAWPVHGSISAVVDVWGWRARFALARGQTIHDVIAKLPAIESGAWHSRGAARVYPTPDDLANRFELRVLDNDPHADAITWPGPSVTSITEPIDLGPFEDAMPATCLLLRRHVPVRRRHRIGQERRHQRAHGQPDRLHRRGHLGNRPQARHGTRPLGPVHRPAGHHPAEARALLADAVAILEARAAHLAAIGQRVWEPAPDMPALVIIIDEYAELTESAPDATGDADSIARRGRAVAVTLIAATQRPTQKAMGQGALRSQMDVRICFRVRERKDVDLILGQGMLAAGWHAHTLNAPGKFLISAPEHDTPAAPAPTCSPMTP